MDSDGSRKRGPKGLTATTIARQDHILSINMLFAITIRSVIPNLEILIKIDGKRYLKTLVRHFFKQWFYILRTGRFSSIFEGGQSGSSVGTQLDISLLVEMVVMGAGRVLVYEKHFQQNKRKLFESKFLN